MKTKPTAEQLQLFDEHGGIEYDHDFIMDNPILATCRHGHQEPIHAPNLVNVRCFWCRGELHPVDKERYQARLATLWQHVARSVVYDIHQRHYDPSQSCDVDCPLCQLERVDTHEQNRGTGAHSL